jgi:hypothetical protein
MEDRYEIRKNFRNQWEVAHHWSDGVTIQVRYFSSLKEVRDYFNTKGINIKVSFLNTKNLKLYLDNI